MGFVGEPRGRLRICSVNSAKQAMRYLLIYYPQLPALFLPGKT
jgi:hypothetical protein